MNASSGVVTPTNGAGTCVIEGYQEADATYCQSNTIQADVVLTRADGPSCTVTGPLTIEAEQSEDYDVTTTHDGALNWSTTGELVSVNADGLATATANCGSGSVKLTMLQSDIYNSKTCTDVDVCVYGCTGTPPLTDCQLRGDGNTVYTFACHNLGADVSHDHMTPGWQLNGEYYQWNRINPVAYAPTSSDNDPGVIGTWDTSNPNGSIWETVNDPCPAGFSVPFPHVWAEVCDVCNNTWSNEGSSWSNSMQTFIT